MTLSDTLASALEEGINEYLSNYDFSDAVNEELPDIDSEIDKAMRDYDFSDDIHDAVRDYDWWEEIEDKVEDEIQTRVDEAVEQQMASWVNSRACKEMVREVIKDEIRGWWKGIKRWCRGLVEEVVMSFGHMRGERF